MGFIAKVLSFVRMQRNGVYVSDVKVNPGGGPNRTAENYAPAGDDSYPLNTDYSFNVPARRLGRVVTLGYVDPINEPQAQPGDKRIYARDAESGTVVVEIWLKNDGAATVINGNASVTIGANGSIMGQNASGQFELETGGNFVANGAKMTTDGDVQTSDGVSLRSHPHSQGNDSDGNSQVPTDPPTPTA